MPVFILTVVVGNPVTFDVGCVVDNGVIVAVTGSFRTLAIDFRASSKGFNADGWAIFCSGSLRATGVGAFLKLGSFGLGLGAEKKDESDLTSLTSLAVAAFTSFLTTVTFDDGPADVAAFLAGGTVLDAGASALRFLLLPSNPKSYVVALLATSRGHTFRILHLMAFYGFLVTRR